MLGYWRPPRLTLRWGQYLKADAADSQATVATTIAALEAGLITKKRAVEKLKTIFGVESIDAEMAALAEERSEHARVENEAAHLLAQRAQSPAEAPSEAHSGGPGGPGGLGSDPGGVSSGDAAPHLANANLSGVADTVYRQLLEDFPKDAIAWVRGVRWTGPVKIPLDSIDFANRDNWRASRNMAHVEDFAAEVKAGTVKPIVLINEPNNERMIIVDGHHRALAAKNAGVSVPAYVAHVPMVRGPWMDLHKTQNRGGAASRMASELEVSVQR